MVSFKAQKSNSRLTDFDDLKDFVVSNTVRSIPRVIKSKPTDNAILGSY